MQIDILTTSASRFYCFKVMMESLKKNLHYTGSFRHILHEDVIDQKDSDAIVKLAQDNNFDKIKVTDPIGGQGPAVTWLFSQVKSKYFLFWEDDWELTKPIDLDSIVNLMECHNKVNQISFHKRPIMARNAWFVKKTINLDGVDLTTSMHWTFPPAIWRYDFIKKYFQSYTGGLPEWQLCAAIKGHGIESQWDADKVMDTSGTYFLGKIGEGHYVRGLADDDSRRKEQIKRERFIR
jgi:hypothetical protein